MAMVINGAFLTDNTFDPIKKAYEDMKQINSKKPVEQKVSEADSIFGWLHSSGNSLDLLCSTERLEDLSHLDFFSV